MSFEDAQPPAYGAPAEPSDVHVDINQPSSNTCPNQHALFLNAATSDGFSCDKCAVHLDKGAQVSSCRSCNYDLCPTCCAPSSLLPTVNLTAIVFDATSAQSTIQIEIPLDATLLSLKSLVAQKKSMEPGALRKLAVISSGRQLSEDGTLSELGLTKESTFHVMVRASPPLERSYSDKQVVTPEAQYPADYRQNGEWVELLGSKYEEAKNYQLRPGQDFHARVQDFYQMDMAGNRNGKASVEEAIFWAEARGLTLSDARKQVLNEFWQKSPGYQASDGELSLPDYFAVLDQITGADVVNAQEQVGSQALNIFFGIFVFCTLPFIIATAVILNHVADAGPVCGPALTPYCTGWLVFTCTLCPINAYMIRFQAVSRPLTFWYYTTSTNVVSILFNIWGLVNIYNSELQPLCGDTDMWKMTQALVIVFCILPSLNISQAYKKKPARDLI